MKEDVKTVIGWDFTRIVPCHGACITLAYHEYELLILILKQDVIEVDAKKAWKDAYKVYLN